MLAANRLWQFQVSDLPALLADVLGGLTESCFQGHLGGPTQHFFGQIAGDVALLDFSGTQVGQNGVLIEAEGIFQYVEKLKHRRAFSRTQIDNLARTLFQGEQVAPGNIPHVDVVAERRTMAKQSGCLTIEHESRQDGAHACFAVGTLAGSVDIGETQDGVVELIESVIKPEVMLKAQFTRCIVAFWFRVRRFRRGQDFLHSVNRHPWRKTALS